MRVSFTTLPDDVLLAILEAHSGRCSARAVTRRICMIVERNFALRHFTPPKGRVFCVDIEVDCSMTKNLYCAQFGGSRAGEAGGVAGEVTFVNWVPAYYRSVTHAKRGLSHEIGDSDACALWRTLSKVREARDSGCGSDVGRWESPVAAAQGHLVLSEGGNRQVIGKLSPTETRLVLNVLDHRKNPFAVLREAIAV
eukprot:TRINITY_DN10749_c1_g1_i3.p1 TRINITY_DN10749_c1_g1~~TRINITY_DN10749_c1_g1_i3.p1  ORF type:complete len:196 (-),score=19.35 TRINITY_DN10749_c1_g1_i3:675-1262(-)